MEQVTSLTFARVARDLAAEARRRGLRAPAFRSPPGLADAMRTQRRQPAGGVVVAVRLRGRRLDAVAQDMVEGVVVANGVSGAAATRLRTALLEAIMATRSTVEPGTWPNRQRQGA
jgi:hypothetical protein